jgi:hypothetical protein
MSVMLPLPALGPDDFMMLCGRDKAFPNNSSFLALCRKNEINSLGQRPSEKTSSYHHARSAKTPENNTYENHRMILSTAYERRQ